MTIRFTSLSPVASRKNWCCVVRMDLCWIWLPCHKVQTTHSIVDLGLPNATIFIDSINCIYPQLSLVQILSRKAKKLNTFFVSWICTVATNHAAISSRILFCSHYSCNFTLECEKRITIFIFSGRLLSKKLFTFLNVYEIRQFSTRGLCLLNPTASIWSWGNYRM